MVLETNLEAERKTKRSGTKDISLKHSIHIDFIIRFSSHRKFP